jgi:alanine racemase
MIDITGVDAKVGDTVTLFGEEPSANEVANILGTIPYEVFTSVARRVRREK